MRNRRAHAQAWLELAMPAVLVFKTPSRLSVGMKVYHNVVCRYVEMCCLDDDAIGSSVGLPLCIQGSRCIYDWVHLRWKLRHGLSPLWILGRRKFPWFNLDLHFYHALAEQARTERVSCWHPRRPRTEQEWMDTSPYWACLCRQCALQVLQNRLPVFCRQADHILHRYHPVATTMQAEMKVRGWEVRGGFQ